jgi:hypothetical protein
MQARLTAYPPDSAALAQVIGTGDAVRIGRAADSTLRIDHPSISRAHAELRVDDACVRVLDLGSKNGSFMDGTAVTDARIDGPCWLRFGDVFCEFLPVSATDLAYANAGTRARRAAATAHTARIEGVLQLDDLLAATLRGVLDLAQCDRGFVLLDAPDGYRVRTSISLDPAALGSRQFSGSVGAVDRALQSHRSVIANDIGQQAWLASRASVAAAGLSALVCLPLLEGDHAIGAVYADRPRAGPPVTALDLELLEAFVERAALWICARRASDALAMQPDTFAHWGHVVEAHAADVPVLPAA